MKAVFKSAVPYLADEMNRPVENLEAAIPFYETIMGFWVVSRKDSPCKSAVLARDGNGRGAPRKPGARIRLTPSTSLDRSGGSVFL